MGENPNLPNQGESGYLPEFDVYDNLTFTLYPKCDGSPVESESDSSFISVTFGRNGDYPLGDRDCDGINNLAECTPSLTIDSSLGILDGTYSAGNEITVKAGSLFGAGKTVTLSAPNVLIEQENDVPLTSILQIESLGCGN